MVNGQVASGAHLEGGSCMRFQLAAATHKQQLAMWADCKLLPGLAPNPSRATLAAPGESDSTEVNQCD